MGPHELMKNIMKLDGLTIIGRKVNQRLLIYMDIYKSSLFVLVLRLVLRLGLVLALALLLVLSLLVEVVLELV